MGRGPVCGMITRRGGGPAGAAGACCSSTGGATAATGSEEGVGAGAEGTTGTCCTGTAGAGVAAEAMLPAAGGRTIAGAGVIGGEICRAGSVPTIAGRTGGVTGATVGRAITGRAITGPDGGRLAIAGEGAGATMLAPWRGSGTIRRGAAGAGGAGEALGATDDAGEWAPVWATGVAEDA